MRFQHAADPARLAEIVDTSTPDAPCLVVHHTDAKGKARKKRYPHGQPFALDRSRGRVWVADTGALRRIQRGSLERVDIDIGPEVMPRRIRCNDRGAVLALITIEPNTPAGSSPWRAPSQGPVSFGVLSVVEDRVELILQVPFEAGGLEIDSLGLCDDGRFLAPHAGGAGLYTADGTVLEHWSAVRTTHYPPRGAVSPSGRWVALTHADGAIRLIDRQEAQEHVVDGPFKQVFSLDVDDGGRVEVRGLGPSDWGLYLVGAESGVLHASRNVDAAVSPCGTQIVNVEANAVRVVELGTDGAVVRERPVPELPMGRRARGRFWDADTVISRSDRHVLAEIDLGRI